MMSEQVHLLFDAAVLVEIAKRFVVIIFHSWAGARRFQSSPGTWQMAAGMHVAINRKTGNNGRPVLPLL
jgi:hypothetical protein